MSEVIMKHDMRRDIATVLAQDQLSDGSIVYNVYLTGDTRFSCSAMDEAQKLYNELWDVLRKAD